MTEKKWTPGPWNVFTLPPRGTSAHLIEIQNNDGKAVVFWTGFDGATKFPKKEIHNAHLIAQAPAMYDALETLIEALTDGWQPDVMTIIDYKSILARARGES